MEYDDQHESTKAAFYDTGVNGTLKLPRAGCGHKIIVGCEPRHKNCGLCWFTFFQIHGEVTQLADDIFRNESEAALVQIKGRTFVNHFKQYMGALAQWKIYQDAGGNTIAQEINYCACGAQCAESDLMCDVYICGPCWNASIDEYEKEKNEQSTRAVESSSEGTEAGAESGEASCKDCDYICHCD